VSLTPRNPRPKCSGRFLAARRLSACTPRLRGVQNPLICSRNESRGHRPDPDRPTPPGVAKLQRLILETTYVAAHAAHDLGQCAQLAPALAVEQLLDQLCTTPYHPAGRDFTIDPLQGGPGPPSLPGGRVD